MITNQNDLIEWQNIGDFLVATDKQHRFGTDAVLLEHFAFYPSARRICDLGSGCGIIPFLICKRGKNCEIYAVEIQKSAANLICQSVLKNFIDNINVVCADARDPKLFKNKLGNKCFDLVVCNPPYYKQNSGAKCPAPERSIAREEETLGIYEAAEVAARILRFGGRFCVCFKPERLCDCIDAMRKNSIEPKKIRMVHTDLDKKPWLVLVEGKKGANPFLEVLPPLVINSKQGQQEIKMIYSNNGK